MRYIALLRGVNVGGKATVKMANLAKALEDLGFTHVKTFLNSGNVLFDTSESDETKLVEKIENKLEDTFGRKIQILLRSQEYVLKMVKKDPYTTYDQTDKLLYFLVVFLKDTPKHALSLPYNDQSIGLTVENQVKREIYLVLDRKQLAQTGDAMKFIGKEFPGLSTSRTWNTVLKLATL